MWFRSTIVVGIPLLLALHGSGAADQRTAPDKYARPPFSTARNPTLPPLPWEDLRTVPRLAPGPATDEDRNWGTEFGLPIPNGDVNCVALFNGEVIVGGTFTQIGGKNVGYIARWDGSQWMSLGAGVDATVDALLADGPDLFVGGRFHAAGGIPVQGLARWDGASWSNVGGDIAVTGNHFGGVLARFVGVRALAIYRDELVAGGDFESTARPEIRGIARFDGSEWQPLGGGIPGVVSAMAVFRDSLYAIGDFDTAGTAFVSNIARWDGLAWKGLNDGIEYPPTALAVYGDRLYVGGPFFRIGALDTPGLAVWDGAEWNSVGDAFSNWIRALAVHQDRLFVADYYGIRSWNGSQWTHEVDPHGWFMAMASNGTDLIVAGDFESTSEQPVINIGRWDGVRMRGFETWNSGMNGLVDYFGKPAFVWSLTSYRDELLAFGYTGNYGGASGWGDAYGIPAWSGTSWRSFDSPAPPFSGLPAHSFGEEIAIYSSGDFLYLGGQFTETEAPSLPHSVIQFDGNTWSSLDTLSGYASAIIKIGGVLYTAVSRTVAPYDGRLNESILRWDGDHWREVGFVPPQSNYAGAPPVVGLSEHEGELVAHGYFDSINGISVNGIARWNGRDWRPFGNGPWGCVFPWNRVAASLGDRLVVQTYDCSNPNFQNSTLQAWDGRSWSPVPGIRGYISSIAGIRGLLYVGGNFELDGIGVGITMATWDGFHWARLGSGFDSSPHAIAEHDGSVYFGGPFSTAGGKSSFGIARWNGLRRAPPLRNPRLTSTGPNPFRAAADLSLQLDGEGIVRVAVYDISGREVAVLEDGFRSAGPHGIRWDGRDRLGKNVPAGVYFVSARSANGSTTSRKVVRLR